jgi:Pyridoxamine 5'-phosphate oxidase
MPEPTATDVHPQFSSPDAMPTPWSDAAGQMDAAKAYWISTVRPDGRPHVTTIAGIWLDSTFYFTTGETERKAANLATNPHVVVTTGTSAFAGVDVVIEGEAIRVTDDVTLQRLADAYRVKYDDMFGFTVRDGGLHGGATPDAGLTFVVRATTAFAFGKGEVFSQTRYRF